MFKKRPLLKLVAAAWTIALFLPAYIAVNPQEATEGGNSLGVAAFLLGLFGTFYKPFPFVTAWLANVFMLLTILRLAKGDYAKAKVFSIVAVLLSLTALLIKSVPKDENFNANAVTIGPAVYIWIASAVILCVSVFVYARRPAVSK